MTIDDGSQGYDSQRHPFAPTTRPTPYKKRTTRQVLHFVESVLLMFLFLNLTLTQRGWFGWVWFVPFTIWTAITLFRMEVIIPRG